MVSGMAKKDLFSMGRLSLHLQQRFGILEGTNSFCGKWRILLFFLFRYHRQ